MRFPDWLIVHGDKTYRGPCSSETIEQIDFVSWLAHEHPCLRRIMLHPKNESKRTWGQVDFDKKMGSINTGASDVIIPALIPLVMELKIADSKKAIWQPGQQDYLKAAHDAGAYVCVALGFEGCKIAVAEWLKIIDSHQKGVNLNR